ncbi:MAG: GDSL-type esterase/lipase family protein [Saprospiraceae bacterium]
MKKMLLAASLMINVLLIATGIMAVEKAGGWRYLRYRIENRGLAATYAHRVDIFQMLPKTQSAIVFLGNSLTAQNEWAEMFGRPDILNRGIPGDHAGGMLERLGEISRHKPSKIFLMAGINDLCFHSPEVVVGKCQNLVEAILHEMPSTRLYIQSVLPVNNDVVKTPVKNEGIIFVNDKMRAYARSKGLIFIDLYPLFLDKKGNLDAVYTLDGVHINGAAYLKWKAAIETYVLE